MLVYNITIINEGLEMLKKVFLLVITLITMSLMTGCMQSGLSPQMNKKNNQNSWAEESNVDDVDVSDLNENMVESEMSMTEEGEGNKIQRIAFPASEYYRLQRTGKGTIKGNIYLQGGSGNHIAGASTRLYLNPITSYSKQWYNQSYLGGHQMNKADDRLFNYLKFTASDSKGEFAFYGVPSGEYYLIGTVKCGEECGYNNGKNIRIARVVRIEGNQVIEKDLSRAID